MIPRYRGIHYGENGDTKVVLASDLYHASASDKRQLIEDLHKYGRDHHWRTHTYEVEGDRKAFVRDGKVVRFGKTEHAPEGGVTAGGKKFLGGQFVPKEKAAGKSHPTSTRIADSLLSNDAHREYVSGLRNSASSGEIDAMSGYVYDSLEDDLPAILEADPHLMTETLADVLRQEGPDRTAKRLVNWGEEISRGLTDWVQRKHGNKIERQVLSGEASQPSKQPERLPAKIQASEHTSKMVDPIVDSILRDRSHRETIADLAGDSPKEAKERIGETLDEYVNDDLMRDRKVNSGMVGGFLHANGEDGVKQIVDWGDTWEYDLPNWYGKVYRSAIIDRMMAKASGIPESGLNRGLAQRNRYERHLDELASELSIRFARGHHAPKGGITIAGKSFLGGQFIPSGYVSQATPEQKAKLKETQKGFDSIGAKTETKTTKAGKELLSVMEYTEPDGSPLEEGLANRVKEMGLPPAWTGIRVAIDPTNYLQAIGYDVKGREQRLYSEAHQKQQSAAKFERVKQFIKTLPDVRKRIADDMNGADGPRKEAAAVLALIDQTGFRIGSDKDTGADKKAFGASNLRSHHASVSGGVASFAFTGKKGVEIRQTVYDPAIAKMIEERQERAGKDGRLFDTNESKVRKYFHEIAGKFKVKDFRTAVAADEALKAIDGMEPPKTQEEYKKKRLEVARIVSAKLGNTPAVALASYIPPEVFGKWQSNLIETQPIKSAKGSKSSQKATTTSSPSDTPKKTAKTGGTPKKPDETPTNQKGLFQRIEGVERYLRSIEERLDAATKSVADPTESQAEAGNYQKGHVYIQGLDVSIETTKGSKRPGKDIAMPCHYGYIRRTKGKDGDNVDVFVGGCPECELVFVIDQAFDGKFDEHKVMIGFQSEREAKEAYRASYPSGWQGLGAINPMTMVDFKEWLADGKRTKPVGKFARDDSGGEWVTIGSDKGKAKGKKGGARVKIQDGKIVAGPGGLVGREMSSLESYAHGKRRKETRDEGIDPADIEPVFKWLKGEDRERVKRHNEMLKTAKKRLGIHTTKLKNIAAKGGDADSLRGTRIDEVADAMANELDYQEYFNEGDPPGDQLFRLLAEGPLQTKDDDDLWWDAVGVAKEQQEDEYVEDNDNPVPFSRDSTIDRLNGIQSAWRAGVISEATYDRECLAILGENLPIPA